MSVWVEGEEGESMRMGRQKTRKAEDEILQDGQNTAVA